MTYFLVLWLVSDSISFSSAFEQSWLTFGFMLLAFLLYGLYYLLPSILITALMGQFTRPNNSRPVYITAIITGAITTLLLYANAKIFALYGMFFNGFILNLVMTPGGIESLGGSTASDVGYALIALGFVLVQILILWLAKRFYQYKTQTVLSFKWLPITAFVATILVHMGFALDSYTTTQLNVVAESVPFYQTVSARSFFSSLGFKTQRDTKLKVKGKLNYPLNPIHFQQPAKPYNIIWLTSESLRADMLDEKIMPNSWAFAKNAARFTRNYSTGNGTRMGVYRHVYGHTRQLLVFFFRVPSRRIHY